MLADDATLLGDLRTSTLSVLEATIGRGATVALLDVPNQRNVGDSMIWAGEVAYLTSLGVRVAHACDQGGYDPETVRSLLPPDGVILLQGGGNFGDLWRGHQRHREQVARDFPDRRIVQLPQSVWFDEPKRAANANRILGAHPDLTVLVRDHESGTRMAEQLPDVRHVYCWDMALGWTPREQRTAAGTARVLVVARTDKEGLGRLGTLAARGDFGADVQLVDWTTEDSDSWQWRAARRIPAGVRRVPALARTAAGRSIAGAGLSAINRANLLSGERLYAGRSLVVVDRLHAHVLAALLGIQHVLLDNSYGKIGAVFREYTGGFSTASFARDEAEAVALAARAPGPR